MSLSTPRPEPSLELARTVAIRAAHLAGQVQLERFEKLDWVRHKGKRDIVTEVDTLCEEIIVREIRAAFPADGIVAEESGVHGPAPGASGADGAAGADGAVGADGATGDSEGDPASPADRMWLVDPLDGTVNYANGIPVFCVSIALAERGQPTMGVVYDPARDEMFWAIRGGGAWLGDERIRNPDKERLIDYVMSLALPARLPAERGTALRRATRAARNNGSSALSLAYVARGRFDAFVTAGEMSSWDVAAGGLIALEGGAAITTIEGGPWFDLARPPASIGLVAAPVRHHAEILALLA